MPTKITINNNASIRIEGDIEMFDQTGNKFNLGGKNIIFLCRCGQSSKKPYCDGTHKQANFKSEIKAS